MILISRGLRGRSYFKSEWGEVGVASQEENFCPGFALFYTFSIA